MLTYPVPSNPISPVNKRSCAPGHAATEKSPIIPLSMMY